MSTEAYHVPDLGALLPKNKINPHLEQVEYMFNTWIEQKLGNPFTAEVYKSESPLFCAWICPLASSEQLRGITDYTAAAFCLDDLIDRIPLEDALALSHLWMKILRDESEIKGIEHPVMKMLHSELLPHIRAALTPLHWPQFIAANQKMVVQMVQEARDRREYLNNNMNLDIESYLNKRRVNIGAGSFLVFARSTRSLYIPDNVIASQIIQEMETAVIDMLIIPNDIYSFKREYTFDGAFSNILTVVEKDPKTAHLKFQQRLDYAGNLFKEALERFHACKQGFLSFGPEMGRSLAMYADGLIDLVIGNLGWSRINLRYDAFTSEQDRENNILRLSLDNPQI